MVCLLAIRATSLALVSAVQRDDKHCVPELFSSRKLQTSSSGEGSEPSRSKRLPDFGSITIDYDDDKYLGLQTAGIQDKDISWTLKALQPTPDTQIQLFISGGIAQYVYQQMYDVFIGLADEPVVEFAEDGFIPRFLERVGRGIHKIKEKYPDAQLHDVDALPPIPSPCESPKDLSFLKVYCEVNEGKPLASVSTGGYDPFGKIYLHEKLLDDRRTIERPINMDIIQADEVMKQARFKGSYTGATLDFSILPSGDEEPNYTFSIVLIPGGPRYVRVGVYDG